MESNIILLSILVVAIIGKTNSVALASCILLFIKLLIFSHLGCVPVGPLKTSGILALGIKIFHRG
ncbi:succinyl-diaminopimelate desuccinylase [Clostridium botulinum]|uniref:succinyl-diaminopimelate desuccinylase n=1 Tax=Clostridium botulinum TaxID=1491 RepID=UPI000AD79F73|nr:succinyl-diaminopimelate desuccinylase [Clostridium botulinum]MBY6799426.1 succinyl-diaminopimelate desuccinylase [Clostridium botulinum]NFA90898.1 succinyl-diaminopimelate desuccinylase [Clostridium botulinum]NFC29095.1 succinyl-diaminopimelate desuccinylase [Clostridium botulinum]NFC62811.1 succinyl-diaminopimelate desuccinylase [Clostridium botulinum]NFC67839.1 succinyl-diaminopimelate desuccinylase [Clostridium botulinum]